jgi:hypothetical protein
LYSLSAEGNTVSGKGRDGTSAVVPTPLELVERLAAVIPPPRTNQILYTSV